MKRVMLSSIMIIMIVLLFAFSSCSTYVSKEGFEHCQPGESPYSLTSELFFDTNFLTEYSYTDGNFFYNFYEPVLLSCTDRSFAWLSYDDEDTYQQAKQSRLDTRWTEKETFDGQEAFGFTFYLYWTYENSTGFPHWFTAFGYDDERQMLVFIGFYCSQEKEEQNVLLAETDFGAFLKHFYGEWFEW